MHHLKKIAGAVALLGCGGTALAQTTQAPLGSYASDWLSGGYSTTPWDNRSPYVIGEINGMSPDDKFNSGHGEGLGLRVGKAVSDHWDVQFGATYDRDNDNDVRYRQNTVGADALYMFSRDRFKPFLLAGGGAQYDTLETPTVDASRWSPYVNAGVGFQYQISDQWGTQVDYRWKHAWLRNSDFNFDKVNDGILSVGLTYYFGKPQMAPAPRIAAAPPPVAPPPPSPPPPPPPPPRFERTVLSSTELFGFDSAELRTPQPKLDEIVGALNQDQSVTNVRITGYTDRIGPDAYNLRLSQRRADAVKNYLTAHGIAASRLEAVGRGKADPVVQCNDRDRAALIKCLEPNRRVEVEQIVIEHRAP